MATQVEALPHGPPLGQGGDEQGPGGPEEEEGGGARDQDQGPAQRGGGGSPEEGDRSDSQEGGGGWNKKDFTEAPPPKVNPWTRNMPAGTVVTLNGQELHGGYPQDTWSWTPPPTRVWSVWTGAASGITPSPPAPPGGSTALLGALTIRALTIRDLTIRTLASRGLTILSLTIQVLTIWSPNYLGFNYPCFK